MDFNLFNLDITELKEEVILKLKNDYKDFELFTTIVKEVFNDDFFGIKFTKEIISAIDGFDIYFAEKNKTSLKPISHFITSVNPFNGLPFFEYIFYYVIEDNVLKINLNVPKIDSSSYLGKRVKEIMDIFIEYVNEKELKARMIEELKVVYKDNVDTSFEILGEYIETNENFTHEDILDALSYSLLGLEHYGEKYEIDKR
ncbi:hypothetical protein [Cetobacterium sp.]|uniref:hypothetical protein n=1 Tax=Cetobacterium sp. TaxID=2071632 RepID=UPI003F3DC5DD